MLWFLRKAKSFHSSLLWAMNDQFHTSSLSTDCIPGERVAANDKVMESALRMRRHKPILFTVVY